jgi:hypothetical protein
MRRPVAYSIYAALIVMAGCGGKQDTSAGAGKLDNQGTGQDTGAAQSKPTAPGLPAIPDTPQPAPRALLATAVMDAPSAQMVTMGRFLDAVQPGMSAALNQDFFDQMVGNLVGLESVSGLDYGKPLRAVILDPKQVSMPIVMVAAVADSKALTRAFPGSGEIMVQMHKGYAAMGTPEALIIAAPYALTAFVAEPAPSAPTLTVQARPLMTAYGGELDMVMGMLETQAANDPDAANSRLVIGKLVDLLKESDRMQLSLDVGNGAATGKVVVFPLAGTRAADLAAQQQPSEFTLAAAVPGGSFFAAGQMSETLLEALDTFNRNSMTALYGAENAEKLAVATRAWYGAMGGEFAMSGSISRQAMLMSGIWTITDAKKAEAAMKQVLAATPSKATTAEGVELRIQRQPRALRHQGVTVEGVRMTGDFKKLPEEQRRVMEAVFGKQGLSVLMAVTGSHAAFAMGPSKDATTQMRGFIDAAKGKKQSAAMSPATAAVLEDAKARRESMVFAFDIAAFMASFGMGQPAPGDWITFGVGFADSTVEMRFTVPASAASLMIQMSMGAP